MRWLLACGLLCALAVRRWVIEVHWQFSPPGYGKITLDWVRRARVSESRVRHEFKRSSARLDSLGAARGRFESLLANLRTDLMRGRQNGTEESSSGSTAGFSSPPAHPIRDY